MELNVVVKDELKPQYANNTDACMDLKAAESVFINPRETVTIKTGLQVAIPEGYVMMIFVRSSIGIKRHLCLANGTGIIDSGYRDEIIMVLHNFGTETQRIDAGDRVCQFILLPFPKLKINQVVDDVHFRSGDRGGGVGSTGK